MSEKIRKIVLLPLIFAIVFACLPGCGAANKRGKTVVCASYAVYDWVRNLTKGIEEIEPVLLGGASDLHSYSPSASDIAEINNSDLFIYTGGASDVWVSRVLKNARDVRALSLTDVLEKHNMLLREDCDGKYCPYDEHIWLSLKNAVVLCETIETYLCDVAKERADEIRSNRLQYVGMLKDTDAQLDLKYREASEKTLIFADRFPFRYIAEDYGFVVHAAFTSCSAESEVSFRTIVKLADELKKSKTGVLLVTESSDGKIAKSVINLSERSQTVILTVDSMESTNENSNKTYIEIMKENFRIIDAAIGLSLPEAAEGGL